MRTPRHGRGQAAFHHHGASVSGKTGMFAPLGRGGMLSSAEDRHRYGGTMTGVPASRGEDLAEPADGPAESAASSSADGSSRRQGAPAATRSIWVLEHV